MKCVKKKYKDGGKVKKSKSERIDDRAEKMMGKARASYTKAEQARKDSDSDKTGIMAGYANRMYGKAAKQEIRAKNKKAKAQRAAEVENAKKSN